MGSAFTEPIQPDVIARSNASLQRDHAEDLDALAKQLARRGLDIEQLIRAAGEFEIALPSWGFSQGGTRFGRFPAPQEPGTIQEKLVAASWVNDLTRAAPRVSLHIPWDRPADPAALKKFARKLGIAFDAMNSNTFQDQPGQPLSYKFGSLSHTDPAVRRQAIEHNIDCIRIGEQLGSKALTVWLADGTNFPGQQHFRRSLDRVIDSLQKISTKLPRDWRLLVEYKPFEPAFYSTVIHDWGTVLMICQALNSQAFALVDLGHHLANTNIEMIVARLIAVNRLGGFHFNDSKYADDDLSAGSIKPYQLFLIFNELVDAAHDPVIKRRTPKFKPAYMLDQSHNIKDPIEDMIGSVLETHRAYVKALLVNRAQLAEFQEQNDVVMAERSLKQAYETDISPLVAEYRVRAGGALDPIFAYRDIAANKEERTMRANKKSWTP
jgi:L-rhamnose isomerase/sugar isomerase